MARKKYVGYLPYRANALYVNYLFMKLTFMIIGPWILLFMKISGVITHLPMKMVMIVTRVVACSHNRALTMAQFPYHVTQRD